jgi:hypothetical protein
VIALSLLYFVDIWMPERIVIAQSPTTGSDEALGPKGSALLPSSSPRTSHASLPLVNQHALLQVHVSIDCTVRQHEEKNSIRLFQGDDDKDLIEAMDTSWFVMITELPHSNVPVDSSISLDQAVDLSWSVPSSDKYSFQGNASLSFLIPLAADTTASSGERTLIVTLMEHVHLGDTHSRIAARRLANLPMTSPSSATTKHLRSNPVVHLELSTSTLCTSMNQGIFESTQYTKLVYTIMLLALGVTAYVYPKTPAQVESEEERESVQVAPEALSQNESTSAADEQASVSPAKLRRAIVIDSPGSSEQDSTSAAADNEERNTDAAARDASASAGDSSASRPRSHIIKPPSLVRIPYAFVAEQENEAASALSVDDSTDQRSVGAVAPSQRDVFPSPVVDVNENGGNEAAQGDSETAQVEEKLSSSDGTEEVSTNSASEKPSSVGDMAQGAFPSPVVDAKDATETELSVKKDTSKVLDSYETPGIVDQEEADLDPSSTASMNDRQDATVQDKADASSETAHAVEKALFQNNEEDESMLSHSSRTDDTTGQQESGAMVDSSESQVHSTIAAHKGASSHEANAKQPDANTTVSVGEESSSLGAKDKPVSAVEHRLLAGGDVYQKDTDASIDRKAMHNASSKEHDTEKMCERAVNETSTIAADMDEADAEPESNDSQELVSKNGMAPIPDAAVDSRTVGAGEQQSKPKLRSKVIDVEEAPIDESNWLRRLRNRPSAIPSSSATEGCPSAKLSLKTSNGVGDDSPTAAKEDKNDELSYVSTLAPDSESNDGVGDDLPDFPFDSSPIDVGNPSGPVPSEDKMKSSDINVSRDPLRPPRRNKRRLSLLKTRYEENQGQQPDNSVALNARPGMAGSTSAKQTPRARESTVVADALPVATNPIGATKPRPKRTPTEAIVPDVVPSVFLQSVANQIAQDVPWDFTKVSSRPIVKKEKRSRRRKRKGPPSTIELMDDASPSPMVVSRGSSHREKSKGGTEKKTPSAVAGKRRRLKK